GCIMIGLFYRATTVLFFLAFTYIFLLDQAQYLNHFYLISLVSFILIFLPAHRAYAVDAALGLAQRSAFVPAWALNWLRFQIAVPYVYGGIAKLNGDWLQGEPMGLWLADRTDFPFIGQWFTVNWAGLGFSYGGLLLDLLFVPLVFWRRTRWFAVLAVTAFHLTNARLFNIGIFPWMMLAATIVFLPESWFRRQTDPQNNPTQQIPRLLLAGLAVYVALQLLVPLRHLAYPSDPSWSEAGHMFAWHMRLRSKDADTRFFAYTPQSGRFWEVDAVPYLTPRQHQQMSDHPEMIRHFARFLSGELQHTHGEPVAIYTWAMVSLNGRPPQLIIDPSVDLAQTSLRFGENDWVLPLLQRNISSSIEPPLLLLHRDEYTAAVNIGAISGTAVNYPLAPGDCVIWTPPDTNLPVLPCNAVATEVMFPLPNLAGNDPHCTAVGDACITDTAYLETTLAWHHTQRHPGWVRRRARPHLVVPSRGRIQQEAPLPEGRIAIDRYARHNITLHRDGWAISHHQHDTLIW
ncbi:MAG: HTTM domain-containing protein, partial [Chloroflexota bacterium]